MINKLLLTSHSYDWYELEVEKKNHFQNDIYIEIL